MKNIGYNYFPFGNGPSDPVEKNGEKTENTKEG